MTMWFSKKAKIWPLQMLSNHDGVYDLEADAGMGSEAQISFMRLIIHQLICRSTVLSNTT